MFPSSILLIGLLMIFINWGAFLFASVSVFKYDYLQWCGLFVSHCTCMCASMPLLVCMYVSMFIYAPWQCIHFLLGKEEQMNKQRVKEGWPGGFCVYVCVCVCTREWEVITKAYFMSCFGPPSEFALCFWVDITPADGWVVSARCVASLLHDT